MNWGLPTAWLMTRPQDVTYTPMWVLLFGSLWYVVHPSVLVILPLKHLQLDYFLRYHLCMPGIPFYALSPD